MDSAGEPGDGTAGLGLTAPAYVVLGMVGLGAKSGYEIKQRVELRDTGLLKLFFADSLDPAQSLGLLTAISQRSEQRLATLRAIEPIALEAREQRNLYPLPTLRMGIVFHQAIVDTCQELPR